MFTGIVEELGTIKSISKLANGAEIRIRCNKILSDIKIGDSICVNGVCQTVTEFDNNSFKVMLSDETLEVTNFSSAKEGDFVNLERALTPNTRLGGHIVSGHIDCVGKLLDIQKFNDFYNLIFEIPENFSKYVVYKGSIAISGISLTIAKAQNNKFTVALIPHTYQNTILKELKIGDSVNIETDILAKYIEKLVNFGDNNAKSSVSMEFLKENGFV